MQCHVVLRFYLFSLLDQWIDNFSFNDLLFLTHRTFFSLESKIYDYSPLHSVKKIGPGKSTTFFVEYFLGPYEIKRDSFLIFNLAWLFWSFTSFGFFNKWLLYLIYSHHQIRSSLLECYFTFCEMDIFCFGKRKKTVSRPWLLLDKLPNYSGKLLWYRKLF